MIKVGDFIKNPKPDDGRDSYVENRRVSKVSRGEVTFVSFESSFALTKLLVKRFRHIGYSAELRGELWEIITMKSLATVKRWTGSFNWKGELHELETSAASQDKAQQNMLANLATTLDRPVAFLISYFKTHTNASSVNEI